MVVEVRDVLGQHCHERRWLMISSRFSSSRRAVAIHRSAIPFAWGARTGVRRIRMPSLAKMASKTL
jgi:hypothetical protein